MAIYRNPDWEDIPIDYGNDEQPEEEASEPTKPVDEEDQS